LVAFILYHTNFKALCYNKDGDDMKELKGMKDGIVGFAIGDAMGTPTEFYTRKELLKNPIMDMVPSIEKGTPMGAWSDDTAMTLAEMQAIIDKGIDYKEMADNFVSWMGTGDFSSTGKQFGIGNTTLSALWRYAHENVSVDDCGGKDIKDNGNGSLMRMLPLAYYFYYKPTPKDQMYEIIKKTSSITHAHEISILGCYIYVIFVLELLKGNSKEEAYRHIKAHNYKRFNDETLAYYKRILKDNLDKLTINDIKSTGYVVDTLEAVLWVFLKAKDYQECIIATTNIGGDTDTIGALVGGLAGIYYGYNTIPNKWLNGILRKDYIENLCLNFEMSVKNGKKN
jgi:ADP-ribosyl-[dinitrogen reductase] hydrolase